MIRFQRTARVRSGKFLEGVQFAKEVAEYINANYPLGSLLVFTELFGDTGTIHWNSDNEDLASIEKVNAQLSADQDYWALLSKGDDLFIEGSLHDTVIQSV